MADPVRFDGAVSAGDGTPLGEARFWGTALGGDEATPWRGWLRAADLGRESLPRGRYRVRTASGRESAFEIQSGRPSRVFETDLLAIVGIEPSPWDDHDPGPDVPYIDLWREAPPRGAEHPRRALELDDPDGDEGRRGPRERPSLAGGEQPSPLGENPDTPTRGDRF